MLLSELLSSLTIVSVNPAAEIALTQNVDIKAVYSDDSALTDHSLMVCIPGLRYDPTDHLAKNSDKEVVYIVEHFADGADAENAPPQILVESAREAIARVAGNFYGNLQDQMAITAITGSNGKTSTSMMVEKIHHYAGLKSNLLGTVRYGSGARQLAAKFTTPEPLQFQELLSEFSTKGEKHLVMEVSSIGHEHKRDVNLAYDASALINLSREHLDLHGTMEAYFEAKAGILEQTKSDGIIVLNYADPYGRQALTSLHNTAQKITYFALETGKNLDVVADQEIIASVDLIAHNIQLTKTSTEFDLYLPRSLQLPRGIKIPAGQTHFCIANPGYHQVLNALAATALCFIYDIKPEQAAAALGDFTAIERRFQLIWQSGPVTDSVSDSVDQLPPQYQIVVYDDHFANITNIETSLKSLLGVPYNKLHIVYAIRGMRGDITNRENIEALAVSFAGLRCDRVYATKSSEVVDKDNLVLPEEEQAFVETMQAHHIPYCLYERLDEAIAAAVADCRPGDAMLLAGCQGMDDGARIFFKQMLEATDLSPQQVMSVIKDRVCGWGDESPADYGLN